MSEQKKTEKPRLCDVYREKLSEHVRRDPRVAGLKDRTEKRQVKTNYAQ